ESRTRGAAIQARKAAEATKSDYLDVYGPTRDCAAKASLFSPSDGVHLTQAGNRFLALEVLKYLGK
ncbi:MAG TPA: hypothetical protein P5137_14940, partial [Candidatus Brocadiia bacterium]|nr:hypothetical protein [Candidatus Brocadiia bacterium]